jgi:hypothetical protein
MLTSLQPSISYVFHTLLFFPATNDRERARRRLARGFSFQPKLRRSIPQNNEPKDRSFSPSLSLSSAAQNEEREDEAASKAVLRVKLQDMGSKDRGEKHGKGGGVGERDKDEGEGVAKR